MAATNQPAPFSPYLTIKGAGEAISWYETVFGVKLLSSMKHDDGRFMHATLSINGHPFSLSDEFPEYSPFRGPAAEPPSPVAISLRLGAPAEVDHLHDQAIAAGAKTSWPPEDMFWGDRFCQIIDPFNHRWMLAAAK
jgi:uncharacterized glyoxalase superfamily protein PhnB